MTEPRWVEADDVHTLNQLRSEDCGIDYHLKDRGLLESACVVPINAWHYDDQTDPFELAILLMMAVARNHPFTDGNKRAAFEAAVLFLQSNEIDVELDDTTEFADLFVAVISRDARESELVDRLREAHEVTASAQIPELLEQMRREERGRFED